MELEGLLEKWQMLLKYFLAFLTHTSSGFSINTDRRVDGI